MALRLSDRGYVIDNGAIRYHGTREDLQSNQDVRNKYLCV
jgi:branched-chain amino acid transport system ATP-binding protein